MKSPMFFLRSRIIANRGPRPNSEFPLLSRERVRVRGSVIPHEPNDTLKKISIAIMLAALPLFAATYAGATSLDDILAKRKPEATIDLASRDGVQLVQGAWRYSDTKIIEIDFRAAGADGQPGPGP